MKHLTVSQPIKRFWKNALPHSTPIGWSILLDKHPLKTPFGRKVIVSHQRLAHILALEWDTQTTQLKPYSLPVSSVVFRSIDGFSDEIERKRVIGSLLKFFDNDTLCFQAGKDEAPALAELQIKHWKPVLSWAEEKYGIKIATTNSLFPPMHNDEIKLKMREVVEGFDAMKLAVFERCVVVSKSFVIGLKAVEGEMNADEAALASRVEQVFQIDRWGKMENGHDIEEEEVRQSISAALVCL